MRCNKKYLCSLFIKDKSVIVFPVIVVAFVYVRNPPAGGLAANLFSPKFVKKFLPSDEQTSHSRA